MIPRKSIGIFVDKLLKLPLSYLVLIYTSKVYSPKDIGAFSLATALASIVFVITDCGVSQYLIEVSSTQDKNKLNHITGALAIRSLANCLLVIALVAILTILENKLVAAILTVLAISNLIMTYPLCLRQEMIDRKEYKLISISDNLSSWILQISKYSFAFLGLNIVFQAVAQLVASAFQSLVVLKGTTIAKPVLKNLNTSIILQIVSRSKHYLLSSMVVFLYAKADQILLSVFHGLAKLAPYSIAVMVIESSMFIFPVLASIFSSTISDQSSRTSSDSLKSLNQFLCLTALIFLCAVITFALIGVPFFFGNKYVGLSINIMTLSPCIMITAITTSLILQMQHERMSKIILIANTVTAVVSLLVSIPLIYYGSGIGASLATSISSAMLPITLLVLGGSKTKYNMHRLAI